MQWGLSLPREPLRHNALFTCAVWGGCSARKGQTVTLNGENPFNERKRSGDKWKRPCYVRGLCGGEGYLAVNP